MRGAVHKARLVGGARVGAFRRLNARDGGHANAADLARIAATWSVGDGGLPQRMGLAPAAFRQLVGLHFPGARLPAKRPGAIPPERVDEVADVYALLMAHRARRSASEVTVAMILAIGCLGQDHLWQDLGLWSRDELSALIQRNFPTLAARNWKNMKWKKFLYKQLCDMERVRACLAPSCEECADYDLCFGPED